MLTNNITITRPIFRGQAIYTAITGNQQCLSLKVNDKIPGMSGQQMSCADYLLCFKKELRVLVT